MSLIGRHYTDALFAIAAGATGADEYDRFACLAVARYGRQWERLAAADLAMARYAIRTIQHAA